MEQTLGYTNYRQIGVTGLSIHVRLITGLVCLETNTVTRQILGLNVYGITINY